MIFFVAIKRHLLYYTVSKPQNGTVKGLTKKNMEALQMERYTTEQLEKAHATLTKRLKKAKKRLDEAIADEENLTYISVLDDSYNILLDQEAQLYTILKNRKEAK